MLKVNQNKDADWPEDITKCMHTFPAPGFVFQGTHQHKVGVQILPVDIKIGISPQEKSKLKFLLVGFLDHASTDHNFNFCGEKSQPGSSIKSILIIY